MYLREIPDLTLGDLEKQLQEDIGSEVTTATMNGLIRARLTGDEPHIVLKDDIEVPATGQGLAALGNWLEIPTPFLCKIDPDLQEVIINGLLDKSGTAEAVVIYSDRGVADITASGARRIRPIDVVSSARRALDATAGVVEVIDDPGNLYRLDTVVPVDFDRGVGGDRKVGDITRGGVRIGVDIKHKLAPEVSTYMYRLWCTNGCDSEHAGLKIDGRGLTLDEMIEHMEESARRAFEMVESDIESYYRLREDKIPNREVALRAVADDYNLPDRTLIQLLHEARSSDYPADEDFTQFDLVNVVTNMANHPSLQNKMGVRQRLERVGGAILTEHASRCSNCARKLN